MICGRCNEKTEHFTGSFFDTKLICMECNKIEKRHPMYKKAKEIEYQEVVKGNYNFEGIGLPDDYYEFAKSLMNE